MKRGICNCKCLSETYVCLLLRWSVGNLTASNSLLTCNAQLSVHLRLTRDFPEVATRQDIPNSELVSHNARISSYHEIFTSYSVFMPPSLDWAPSVQGQYHIVGWFNWAQGILYELGHNYPLKKEETKWKEKATCQAHLVGTTAIPGIFKSKTAATFGFCGANSFPALHIFNFAATVLDLLWDSMTWLNKFVNWNMLTPLPYCSLRCFYWHQLRTLSIISSALENEQNCELQFVAGVYPLKLKWKRMIVIYILIHTWSSFLTIPY